MRLDASGKFFTGERKIVEASYVVAKGVARKKLRGGPNFATFNVTSFSYNGILPFVNYARR